MKMKPPIISAAEPGIPETLDKKVEKDIDFHWGVKIPMRDGVELNATLYKPKDSTPVPAVFTLTPYIADSYHSRAMYFAQHGYSFALVDCRGRGNSGGEFEPFVNEGSDGSDVVQWLAAQDWCDGQVTMWGGSYAGFDQWMTLKEFPPQLKTIVPVASAYAAIDFPFYRNIFYSYEMQWLTFVGGVTGNANLFGEQNFWIDKFQDWFRSGRAYNELDQVVGNPSPIFQRWLQHPTPDAYWKQMWLTPEEYSRINIPVLTITGHYDGDQPGALNFYQQHMRYGSASAKSTHYLVIGPWDHPGTRTPDREFGGLKFCEASLIDMNQLHKDWYDWTMKGGEKPKFLKDRVAYYVMGADEWKYATNLESIATERRRFYLNSLEGQANDVFQSGSMDLVPPVNSTPDQYVYDPLDLRMADLETEEVKEYLVDQRYDLNLFGQGLVYHSPPFREDLEITGWVKLALWMTIDQPDTDFQALLSVIAPDGSYTLLTSDLLRARYRSSLEVEELVVPGEINCYTFEGFMFFSYKISQGSRLRLVVRAPNSVYFQKNFNSGGEVAAETAQDARTVRVTLYHDSQHTSYLEVPIVANLQ
jgi:putative CocE/NonD family hydrolase